MPTTRLRPRIKEEDAHLVEDPELEEDDSEEEDDEEEVMHFGDISEMDDLENTVPDHLAVTRSLVDLTPKRASPAARARLEREAIETDEEFQSILTELDFQGKGHKMSLKRERPLRHRGVDIAGHLDTFEQALSLDDIKQMYGGGHYEVTIRGPAEPGATREVTKLRRKLKISGLPKLQEEQEQKLRESNDTQVFSVVKDVLAKSERESEQLRETLAKIEATNKKTQQEQENKMMELVTALMMGNKPSAEAEAQRLEREEQRRKEERERFEAAERRREEREEQWRREEKAREEARLAREEQWRREEKAREEARVLQQQQLQTENTKMMLGMMQALTKKDDGPDKFLALMQAQSEQRAAADRESNRLVTTMLQNNMQSLMQQQMTFAEQKDKMYQSMMKKDSGLDGMLDTMLKLREFGALGGGGGDDRGTAERIVDKITDTLPGLAAGFAGMRGALPQAPSKPQLGPGAVAEVDLPVDQEAVARARARRRKRREEARENPLKVIEPPDSSKGPPPEPQAATQPQPQPQAAAPTQPPQAPPGPPPQPGEPLVPTEFVKGPFDSVEDEVSALVQNIELALRKDYEAEELLEEVELSPVLQSLILGQTGDGVVQLISRGAPPSWEIGKPSGARFVKEAHALLAEQVKG